MRQKYQKLTQNGIKSGLKHTKRYVLYKGRIDKGQKKIENNDCRQLERLTFTKKIVPHN